MSIILAESVAVSKSKLTKGFNGDSLNLDGRVVSVDGADKGFKAAGNVKPPYTAVVSSSNRKGFANGAATAFNDYVKNINENIGESQQMFNTYFSDMRSVTEKCEIPDSYLSIGAVTVCDNCVIAAKSGNTHILRYSDGELFEIALSEEDGGFGYQLLENALNGDIFALISEEASDNLDYDGIINVFDSGKDLKSMVGDFFNLLPVKDGKDCTVVLIRLKVKEAPVIAPVIEPVAETVISDAYEKVEETDDVEDSDANEGLEDFTTQHINRLGKKKILGLIPIIALVVIIAVAVGLYAAKNLDLNGDTEDPSDDVPAYVDGTDDETTTELQSQEDTSEAETTTAEEETTTEAETTTQRQEEPATQAPETTTQPPVTTTQPPVTTTQPPVTTTQPPVTTTQPPVTTTQPPVTTTEPPVTTTERPTQTPPDWWDIDEPYYG